MTSDNLSAVGSTARRSTLATVLAVSEAIVDRQPGHADDRAILAVLEDARLSAERGADDTGAQAAAAIRTARAYVTAGQFEDAFLALDWAATLLTEH